MKYIALLLLTAFLAINVTPTTFAKGKEPVSSSEKATKKKKLKVVNETLAQSIEQVHTASLEALAIIGCKIKKDTATYIEGKRPNKMGAAVGSGGEVLKITLKAAEDNKTEITVVTKKTMVGLVGQKLWSQEVLAKIKSILAE